jgi:GcrA cell cycle regulator
MEWNDTTKARPRQLWDEGLSTAEIGRRLGTTKNAVVGKAHYLDLPGRPSPIRPRADHAPAPRPRRAKGQTLAPLPALEASTVTEKPATANGAAPAVPVDLPSRPSPRQTQFRTGAKRTCCWPIGEPGTSRFGFCGAEVTTSKPYCDEHSKLAYVEIKPSRRTHRLDGWLDWAEKLARS